MLEAVQCPQCGAGISQTAQNRAHERACEYCGSVIRADSRTSNQREEHDYLCSKHCPRCHHKTVDTEVDDVHLRACHHCGGLWVPHAAFRRFSRLSKSSKRNLLRLNRSRVMRPSREALARHGVLRCPQCAKSMKQKMYTRGAYVTVDICRKHGAWFDENELAVAHRDLAKQMGLRESNRGNRRRSRRSKWRGRSQFRGELEFGVLYLIFRVLAEIIDEVFD